MINFEFLVINLYIKNKLIIYFFLYVSSYYGVYSGFAR
jgi:hypothetical protein